MIVFWVILNAPVIVKRTWRDKVRANMKNISEKDEEMLASFDGDTDVTKLPTTDLVKVLRLKGPDDPVFLREGKCDFGHRFVRIIYYWENIKIIFKQGSFNYIVFYMIISIIGYGISEIVYCFHLLDIINRFDTLQNVIKAVTTNIR
mmetsp:Transcript_28121/g.24854  ORF Transcript_28121/g.24854 Transcript_28121/m.24854 type:complete len:147 (+) Transcript_28121:2248-2688(+)